MNKPTIAGQVYSGMLAKRSKSLRSAADLINEEAEKTVRRVPESFFYVKLFPIIRDWLEGRENENTGFWFNVANSPSNEIIVIDDDTGEEVFRCPPATMLHAINYTTPGSTGITLERLLQRQDALQDSGNIRGALEIEGTFANSINISTNSKRYLENVKQFLWIYERYELTARDLFGEQAPEIIKVLNEVFPEEPLETPSPTEAVKAPSDPDSHEPDFNVDDYDY